MHVSFLPRNLDIWPQSLGAMKFKPWFRDNGIRQYDVIVDRLVAITSPPAILHTNKEARQVGLDYYRLDFDVDHLYFPNHNEGRIQVNSPARIYRNTFSDRICPIGYPISAIYDCEAFDNILNVTPASCAIYVSRLDVERECLENLVCAIGGWPREILLYYSRVPSSSDADGLRGVATLGEFSFVPLDKTKVSKTEEEALTKVLNALTSSYLAFDKDHAYGEQKLWREFPKDYQLPVVKLVSVTINGVAIRDEDRSSFNF